MSIVDYIYKIYIIFYNHSMSESSATSNLEQSASEPTNFEVSIKRLYNLIDQDDSATYMRIKWNENESSVIDSLELMEAVPTGARRQERKGEFNQAQFKVRTHGDMEVVSESHYAWFVTGLKSPGTPIVPHDDSLQENFGYDFITPENVTDILVKQAKTINDYMSLMNVANERGVELPKEFVRGLKLASQRTLYGSASNRVRLLKDIDLENVFTVRDTLREVDEGLANQIQDKIVLRLTEPFRSDGYLYSGAHNVDSVKERDESAAMLQGYLSTERLPNTAAVRHRLFEAPMLFEYRFVTDMLYDEITQHTYSVALSRRNIFTYRREDFTTEFIKNVLAGESRKVTMEPNIQANLTSFITGSPDQYSLHPGTKKPKSKATPLLLAADQIPDKFGFHAPFTVPASHMNAREEEEMRTAKLYGSFERVLEYIVQHSNEDPQESELYTQKCLEIVRLLQRPLLVMNIGKKAVETTESAQDK